MPGEFLNVICTNFAVGALDNISVNTLCARSNEGFVVLLIDTGFITLLNKISRLYVGAAHFEFGRAAVIAARLRGHGCCCSPLVA